MAELLLMYRHHSSTTDPVHVLSLAIHIIQACKYNYCQPSRTCVLLKKQCLVQFNKIKHISGTQIIILIWEGGEINVDA